MLGLAVVADWPVSGGADRQPKRSFTKLCAVCGDRALGGLVCFSKIINSTLSKNRRRICTEEKAKVVAAVLGKEFI